MSEAVFKDVAEQVCYFLNRRNLLWPDNDDLLHLTMARYSKSIQRLQPSHGYPSSWQSSKIRPATSRWLRVSGKDVNIHNSWWCAAVNLSIPRADVDVLYRARGRQRFATRLVQIISAVTTSFGICCAFAHLHDPYGSAGEKNLQPVHCSFATRIFWSHSTQRSGKFLARRWRYNS